MGCSSMFEKKETSQKRDNTGKNPEETAKINNNVDDQKEAQTTISGIVDEIVKNLHANYKGYKFIVNGTIFQKGDSSLHYSSTCLWNPNTDGSTTQRYENDTLHAFATVFGIVA